MSAAVSKRVVTGALLLVLGACAAPQTPGGPSSTAPAGPLRPLSTQPTAADGALECPASLGDASGVTVPAPPEGLDGNARLLPDRAPTSLVVCSYLVLDAMRAEPLEPPYAVQSRTVPDATVRRGIVELVTWAPRAGNGAKACTAIGGNETVHLVGATYEDAVVWVAAKADPNLCYGATNGDFTSRAAVGVALEGLLGVRDPLPQATGGCDTRTLGRLGDDESLAPEGDPQVTVCRTSGSGDPKPTVLDASAGREVVTALRGLAVRPGDAMCEGAGTEPGADFRLVLHYPVGPDVVVNVLPGCVPPVLGGGLSADDTEDLVELVEQWSSPIPGPDPDAPVSTDATSN